MLANRQQCCSIFGLTRAEFDRLIPLGFPARKKSASRGQDWVVDTVEAAAWLVEQEVAKVRPRPAAAKPDFSAAPPGWEAFKAVEQIENPLEGVAMLSVMTLLYALPRLAANVAADEGASIDQTFKISVGVLVTAWTWCHQRLPYWPKDEDAVSLHEFAFDTVNWPWLAQRAGSPDWMPPAHASGWAQVTPDEHAECIRHGEAIEEKYRLLAAQDAAARADA